MIRGIQKIKDLGVFGNYNRPADTENFTEKNIIYGWNYSGKTTLSRLFYILETKKLHPDFPKATFLINDDSTTSLNNDVLEADTKIVRVFNSEFIDRNLSWNGAAFAPILLLGEESIQTEQEILAYKTKLEKCRAGYKTKRTAIAELDREVSEKKTNAAKYIKTTLSLVETFTATHLNNLLTGIAISDPKDFVLSQELLTDHLRSALSSNKDKLDPIQKITLIPSIGNVLKQCKELLSKVPEFSSTIDYFRDNPAIANWVELGLPLHENSSVCEFCENKIDIKRMESLRAHFSKDLANYRHELQNAQVQIQGAKIKYEDRDKSLFYPNLKEAANTVNTTLKKIIKEFNDELDKLANTIDKKLKAPFEKVDIPQISEEYEKAVRTSIESVNTLIEKNNDITINFGKEKANAIACLKNHYAAEFVITEKLPYLLNRRIRLEKHQQLYHATGSNINASIALLEAKINLAQKGREQMNGYISSLIGSSNIQIEVINEDNVDRFRLVREGSIAKNLSEGEKTAIAFSFFLTKLCELKDFKDVIVYIDDPISSLDSNHIFQVNAIIKEQFFYQDATKEWKTKCKQLFISTHNFEFLTLLKELPCNDKKTRYYQVKRVTSTTSEFTNLPSSITKYSSEYHYLYSVIHRFHHSKDKGNLELLLSVPNAVRRFVELYTFARIPTTTNIGVDERATILFGAQNAKRVLKVLHHFSHLNNIERLTKNTDLICDIENAVADLILLLKEDKLHFQALEAAVI